MARFQLWARRQGETAPVKLWDGATTADVWSGRDYDAAVGLAMRSYADAVLRDTASTTPTTRIEILFTRYGAGEPPQE